MAEEEPEKSKKEEEELKEDKESEEEETEDKKEEEESEDEEPKKSEHKHHETKKSSHKEKHHKSGVRKHHRRPKTNVGLWQTLTVIFAALFIIAVFTDLFEFDGPGDVIDDDDGMDDNMVSDNDNGEDSGTTDSTVTEKAQLEFYVMSQCPYGTQVEDAIQPVLEEIGDNVDFKLYFIANENADGTYRSLHGQAEVDGDIVQVCAAEYEPELYMDMVVCMNENANNIPDNWEACAEDLNMDVASIKECYEGEEGKTLFSENIQKAAEVGATGSPTIYLNGERYNGGRTELDFKRAICTELDNSPQACKDLPEPAKVLMTVLNDERCGQECDVTSLVAQLKGLFPGMELTQIDYNSDEGKALYETLGNTKLPAILFDESVNDAANFDKVENYLVDSGNYKSLKIGAQFDPTAEICDNGIDDTGNGQVDCDDDTCKGTMECREEKENNLQVFIMSDCPYGRKAVEALKGVVDHFGDSIDFEVHYIANENGEGTFQSLHGQYEVEEDIVQLCVKEHSPDAWLDYIYCRSTNGVSGKDWKECAGETGVDEAAVQECFDGDEGKSLLSEDIKIANVLNIGASPTWIANNRYTFSGIDQETVKTNLCQYNEGLEGCDTTLSSDTGGVASGSC